MQKKRRISASSFPSDETRAYCKSPLKSSGNQKMYPESQRCGVLAINR